MRIAHIPAGLALLCLSATIAAAQAPDGAKIYDRCAVCHLPSGAGVPGTFPPLHKEFVQLAGSPEGRRYLVLAVTRGLAGPITVEGKDYRGIMPAQATLTDAEVAAALNFVLDMPMVQGKAAARFTAQEVGPVRAAGSSLSPAQVAALKPGAR